MRPTRPRLVALLLAIVVLSCGDTPISPAPIQAVRVPGGVGYFSDADGREILIRGVNVNSLGEYWQYDEDIDPVYPFGDTEMDELASMGFNLVRLIVSWSLIEPEPGRYDNAYLSRVAEVAEALHDRGIYTLVDLHQDAWGPSLAARPDEVCPDGTLPASGWDGAPGWATIVDDTIDRCVPLVGGRAIRELSPAVIEAWRSFMRDVEGPGGVGVQTRFHDMLEHVATRLARRPGVMGYDIINEPNIFLGTQFRSLEDLYARAVDALRAGERRVNAEPRLIIFEPSANWGNVPSGFTVGPFTDDEGIVYGPHTYQGSISAVPLDQEQVTRVRDEVARYGGIPVLVGEWGATPSTAGDMDGYFETMIRMQDEEHWGTAYWVYQAACGDPHYDIELRLGHTPSIWGFRPVDCSMGNTPGPLIDVLVERLGRPAMHYAPGTIDTFTWDPYGRTLDASGDDAPAGNELVLFTPGLFDALTPTLTGLSDMATENVYGGRRITATADGGAWRVQLQ